MPSPSSVSRAAWRRRHRRTVRWCRRFARRGGRARRRAGGCSRTRCPRREPPSGGQPPSRPRHSWRSFRNRSPAGARGPSRRKPCESCRSSGTSNVLRRPAKYSSISRARRPGAQALAGCAGSRRGPGLQHEVVVLARVRDPDQALRRWPPTAARPRGCRWCGRRRRGDPRRSRRPPGAGAACRLTSSSIVGNAANRSPLVHHRASPFGNVFRKVAMPSAAARRAASALPPTISAICR